MLRRSDTIAVHCLFFLSGTAGLGYEIVWTRMFAVGLGHELPGVLAVVAAFFGGFALGAWGLDGVVSRSSSPGRWYAALEAAIGCWAAATILVIPSANAVAADWIGLEPSGLRHWAISFALPLAVLSPATAAMGATLPAIDRLCCRLRRDGRSVAGLYAVNTLGAVLGIVVSTFLLIPLAGHRRTLLVLAAVNLFCALGILLWPARGERSLRPAPVPPPRPRGTSRAWVTLFATGLLGVGYEILGVRIMGQVLENTVYSFAAALCVYLLGTAVGAALYHAYAARRTPSDPLSVFMPALAICCGLGILVLRGSHGIYEESRALFGAGFAGSVGAEFLLAALTFLVPTMLMGATFSHLALMARGPEGGVGAALALNTLGAALAPPIFGVLLLPQLGGKSALLCLAAGYIVLSPKLAWRRLFLPLAILAGIAVAPLDLFLIRVGKDETLVERREGVMAAVAVVDQPHGARVLKVNERFQMGGTGPAEFGERRRAHIPLMLHSNPRRALFLGTGTGVTFSSAADYDGLSGDGVELLPECVELMPLFERGNAAALDSQRLKIHVADARRFVRAADQKYDVVVADLFHPARDGSGSLYTVEHFAAMRERLAAGGLFCQWLPLYQMDVEVVRAVTRSLLAVFPHCAAVLGLFNVQTPTLALVASEDELRYSADWYERRVAQLDGLAGTLERFGLRNGVDLFGCFVAGPKDLRDFGGAGPLNTDDRPLVSFAAPHFVYAKTDPGYGTLLAILRDCQADPAAFLEIAGAASPDAAFAAQVRAYRQARDQYLHALVLMLQERGEEAIEKMLESVRTSPDFRTAYETLLDLAARTAPSNPAAADSILRRLQEANPARREAAELRRRLSQQQRSPNR